MAKEKKLHNISDNDLAKFQGYLNEIEEAYTTDRDGGYWKHFSEFTTNQINRLSIHLIDGHEQSKKNDASDRNLLPVLETKLKAKTEELETAEGKEKELLELSKASIESAIAERKKILKVSEKKKK